MATKEKKLNIVIEPAPGMGAAPVTEPAPAKAKRTGPRRTPLDLLRESLVDAMTRADESAKDLTWWQRPGHTIDEIAVKIGSLRSNLTAVDGPLADAIEQLDEVIKAGFNPADIEPPGQPIEVGSKVRIAQKHIAVYGADPLCEGIDLGSPFKVAAIRNRGRAGGDARIVEDGPAGQGIVVLLAHLEAA